jgi:6-phosphogluconolactonase
MRCYRVLNPTPRRGWTILFLAAFLLITLAASAAADHEPSYFMYVSAYTLVDSTSKGIYAYRFTPGNGEVQSLGLAAETVNPSFLAAHPNRRFLYAVNEVDNYKGQKSGAVSAFAIDAASGKLTLLNQVSSIGPDPCYLVVDKAGKFLLIANYTGGSVAVFPILADGRLGEPSAFVQHEGHGPNAKRQEAAHAHSIDLSPDNRFAIVDDLGMDETLVYKFDAKKGTLTPNDPPFAKAAPGAGPRHFTFSPNGKFGYVIDELGGTVSVFSFDAAAGVLRALQTISTLPKDFSRENTDAEIEIDPNGKFLYASNRGHDSIAVFAIDPSKGTLTLVEMASSKGKTPRNFIIAPGGRRMFVANQQSNNIVVFNIAEKSGRLTPTGKVLEISQPVCVKFVAAE